LHNTNRTLGLLAADAGSPDTAPANKAVAAARLLGAEPFPGWYHQWLQAHGRLATVSRDGTARVWGETSGREQRRFRHGDWVLGVAFSPVGGWLATASRDHTARIWDATSGTELCRLTLVGGVEDVAFSPDGRWLATASDKTAQIWAIEEGSVSG
jgi:WD40 repeat protein